MSNMMIVYSIIVFLYLFFSPSEALAWGPGMHTYIAISAIADIAVAAPVIRSLIKSHQDHFVYGSVSPDILVGKKYMDYIHHCHNWRMGRLILSEAKDDRQKAAAYGYLVHLAADVVAHNYYIPYKIVRSFKTRMLSHTYWEMRFDMGLPDMVWKEIGRFAKCDFSEFDSLLDRVLRRTVFSFRTNKRIFSSILKLQRMRGMRESLKLYSQKSRWEIEMERREHYIDLTLEAVLEFLKDPRRASVVEVDPTGTSRLAYAKHLRRRMKALFSRGMLDHKDVEGFLDLVQERLALGLYRPNLVMPDVTDIL